MIQVFCSNCGVSIQKWPKEYNRSKTKRFFCNRSCATSFNNRLSSKRKVEGSCAVCSKPIKSQWKYCHIHRKQLTSYDDLTYEEITRTAKYQKNAIIRNLARRVYFESTQNRSCEKCGYEKHIEIHHIKEIGSFTPQTKISDINNLSNLMALCPNCHWEIHNLCNIGT